MNHRQGRRLEARPYRRGKLRKVTLDTSLHFVICSDTGESRQVQERILEELQRHRYFPDATFAIRLALEEGLINAIKHGNKFDRSKKVRIEATVTSEQTEISIEDEGPGFDRHKVPDPTVDENLHRLHGRGILLIESYMNEVQWQRGGRRLRMLRRNTPGGEGRACCGTA
jgi:serine/threonine-protein kinase RsbW